MDGDPGVPPTEVRPTPDELAMMMPRTMHLQVARDKL